MTRDDYEQGRADDVVMREEWALWESADRVTEDGRVRTVGDGERLGSIVAVYVDGNRVAGVSALYEWGKHRGWHDVSDFSPEAGPSYVYPTMTAAAIAAATPYVSTDPVPNMEPF